MENKYYAGIGSRQTPIYICNLMTLLAQKLDKQGYILRSGGAKGADTAFSNGSKHSEIFVAKDAKPWAFIEVRKFIPNDRQNFDSWSHYVKQLLARNMMQVLGENGDKPVKGVVCWTPSNVYEDSSSGGTGYAIRCALHYGIPVFNLMEEKTFNLIKEYVDNDFQLEMVL